MKYTTWINPLTEQLSPGSTVWSALASSSDSTTPAPKAVTARMNSLQRQLGPFSSWLRTYRRTTRSPIKELLSEDRDKHKHPPRGTCQQETCRRQISPTVGGIHSRGAGIPQLSKPKHFFGSAASPVHRGRPHRLLPDSMLPCSNTRISPGRFSNSGRPV